VFEALAAEVLIDSAHVKAHLLGCSRHVVR